MKKKILFSSIFLIIMLIVSQASYAAVEIVPSKTGDGKDAIVNTTVSNSYLLCQGMKDTGGTLKRTSVKPHLATNKDWGAVSYLSNSIYGTNTQGGNNGVQVTINGVNYYSTTTNITGVMNWGSNPNKTLYTQTAGLINNYDPDLSSAKDNVTELYNNRETKYVDYINPTNAASRLGMSLDPKSGQVSEGVGTSNNYPSSVRIGLRSGHFGSTWAGILYGFSPNGQANGNVTFRPVVWN